jgi:phage terminase small subunit
MQAEDFEKLFIQEYLVDLNRTKAYARAKGIKLYGNATASIRGSAYRIYNKLEPEIRIAMEERGIRTKVTADKVMREAAYIALSDMGMMFDDKGELLPIHKLPKSMRAAIASYEIEEMLNEGVVVGKKYKVKFWDKNKSLDTLFKHHGLYKKDNEQKPVAEIGSFEDLKNALWPESKP